MCFELPTESRLDTISDPEWELMELEFNEFMARYIEEHGEMRAHEHATMLMHQYLAAVYVHGLGPTAEEIARHAAARRSG